MRSSARLTALLACAALGAAGRATRLEAQVFGLPVRNAGIPTGLTLAADVGFPNGDGGKGWAIGASAAVGLGPLGVSGSAAYRDPRNADAFTSVGATGNLKIFGGPLIPLSVTAQAGVAYGTQEVDVAGTLVDTKLWHFPVGVGLALTIPNPVLAIKPWIAPRLDVSREEVPAGNSDTDTNFGLSAGVDLTFLNGIGIRAMYDRVQAGGGSTPAVVSVGLSWGLRVGR